MCILYLHTTKNQEANSGYYKLILVANRDEFYHRPTRDAQLWPTHPKIIGGIDMEKGREGGTWLAASEEGKIAALLNIVTAKMSPKKRGRGFLVPDFLLSKDKDGMEYLRTVSKDADQYNPFNLVTVDVKAPDGPSVCYYTNSTSSPPQKLQSANGVFCFGNTVWDMPLLKVADGRPKFEKIVENFNERYKKDALIEELLQLVKSREKHQPDPLLKNLKSAINGDAISSRFVYEPENGYGTRTHTIILVDQNNVLEYHEYTMKHPVNPIYPVWGRSDLNFDID